MTRIPASILHALVLFAASIALGAVLFTLDFYTLYQPWLTAGLLVMATVAKLMFFVRSLLGWIRKTVESTEHFYHLTTFVGLAVLLVISSYALDYYCLYRIYPHSFQLPFGESKPGGQLITFFYLSTGVFSTAGSSEVYPTSLLGQLYVTSEMLFGYAVTVLIIANLGHLRSLFQRGYDS